MKKKYLTPKVEWVSFQSKDSIADVTVNDSATIPEPPETGGGSTPPFSRNGYQI